MKAADKNRDPERARKRAMADFRCAVRKLAGEAGDASPAVAAAITGWADRIEEAVAFVRGESDTPPPLPTPFHRSVSRVDGGQR